MGLLYTLIIGFLVGLVARALMPGRDSAGFIVTSLLGIAGSIVASYLGQSMGVYTIGEPAGFLSAVFGSMLVLFIYRVASTRAA